MQRIINFILRYGDSFLYGILAFISLVVTIRAHSYHQSKFFNSSKRIVSEVYAAASNISSYFSLKEENDRLGRENERLRGILFNFRPCPQLQIDTTALDYEVTEAMVIKNSFALPRNYLTISKGEKHGIEQDMGVITTQGILGIVENTSLGFATVQSVLNTKSNINAKIKHTNYFGSLVWNGKDYDMAQLVDIPRLVPLVVGDTIVTGAMSSIFPENIPIGTIKKYDLNTSGSFYDIDVELFNDMANVKNIYVIKNKNKKEIGALESLTADE